MLQKKKSKVEPLKDRIKTINAEMLKCQHKLDRMKKLIPLALLVGIIFSFTLPFIPTRGRKPMTETWVYTNAVIFSAFLYAIIYPASYIIGKQRLKKKLRELKLEKHLLEKELSSK